MNRHPAVAGPTPLLSYRALLRLDAVANLLLATSLARLAERMFGLSVVLYGLERFHAPQLAGWAACAAMAPGLLVGPLARALLDRIGAAWAIALDMACSAGCILVLALLCLARADNAVSLLTLVVPLFAEHSAVRGRGADLAFPTASTVVPMSAIPHHPSSAAR